MSLPTGWICLNGETKLTDLNGLDAELLCYFANPHRMLVVRFSDVGDASEPVFLLCTGVISLQAKPYWSVGQIRHARGDDDTIVLEDPQNSFHAACQAARVFTDAELRRWLGKDYTFVNPTPQGFYEVLKDTTRI
ncbi:MAG TPA: hypothetical protein VF278_01765 [Pirellulales bacterium]